MESLSSSLLVKILFVCPSQWREFFQEWNQHVERLSNYLFRERTIRNLKLHTSQIYSKNFLYVNSSLKCSQPFDLDLWSPCLYLWSINSAKVFTTDTSIYSHLIAFYKGCLGFHAYEARSALSRSLVCIPLLKFPLLFLMQWTQPCLFLLLIVEGTKAEQETYSTASQVW